MKRLNIFVDETGEFGFESRSSIVYGVSFTFHEQDNDIYEELNNLNARLKRIDYTDMIHTANLIMRRGDYEHFNIGKRKSIFNAIYLFSRNSPIKIKTIIVDKRYADSKKVLKQKLSIGFINMINENKNYFDKFDYIVMYYDNGQVPLGKILDSVFSNLNGFEHRINFDHKEKRLFQVSDMLTYIDKYDYKYRNKMSFTKSEKYFFTDNEIKKILKELNKKRL